MDLHGFLNFQNNEARQIVLESETAFPDTPVVGRTIFTGGRVYICVALNGVVPVWIPLTTEIDTFIHSQTSSSTTWTVTHNLNTGVPVVQVYDDACSMIIPNSVVPTTGDALTITLGVANTGTAVVLKGQLNDPSDGFLATVLAPLAVQFVHDQTVASTTWVINHKLGYQPIVRVFNTSDIEIQPASIVHNSAMQVVITFSSSLAGSARLV